LETIILQNSEMAEWWRSPKDSKWIVQTRLSHCWDVT